MHARLPTTPRGSAPLAAQEAPGAHGLPGVPSPWATATGQLLARFPSAVQLEEAVGGQHGSRARARTQARTQARVTRVQGGQLGSCTARARVAGWSHGANALGQVSGRCPIQPQDP